MPTSVSFRLSSRGQHMPLKLKRVLRFLQLPIDIPFIVAVCIIEIYLTTISLYYYPIASDSTQEHLATRPL